MTTTVPLFDTHAHLDEDAFAEDVGAVLQRAHAAGVAWIITIGTTADSSEAAVALAARWPGVSAAVGVQPNYTAQATLDDWDRIVQLASAGQVRALGETGLDGYWDYAPMEVQREWFDRHLRLSQKLDLPFVVHMRDCSADTIAALRAARERGPLRGVMHSFTGDLKTAHECLALGLYVSFAGMVTFKKSDSLRDIARDIPHDRILIETDSPYLAPHPHRGQRPNEPALLVHTAECLAHVRGVPLAEFAALTTANACRLFDVVLP